MASTYSYPEEYWAWYVKGDRIALVQDNSTSAANEYESADESITDGCLIEYRSKPTQIENKEDKPDCEEALHRALIDYIKWQLWDEKRGEEALIEGNKFKVRWERELAKVARRDKVGGARVIIPPDLT